MAAEHIYRKLNVADLSAIILKGSPAQADRDAGFCSGSSEAGDDLSMDHSRLEPRSPTDASEDSVEVKVNPISYVRNKRKSTEPSRVVSEVEQGPLKKRIRYTSVETAPDVDAVSQSHFRPWDQRQHSTFSQETMPNPAEILIRHPGVTTLHRVQMEDSVQDQPLALVKRKTSVSAATSTSTVTSNTLSKSKSVVSTSPSDAQNFQESQLMELSNRACGNVNPLSEALKGLPLTVQSSVSSLPSTSLVPATIASTFSDASSTCSQSGQNRDGKPHQRNYKNMTRERRIEANARERTRVHTISAAYDTLRRSVPAYSNTQKLSKLSVLRVACSYILSLSRMAGEDYSEDQSSPSIADCFEMVTKTIQTEGKIRKKKDE